MWFSKWAFASSLRFFSFVLSNSSFSNSPGGSIVGHAISQQIPCRCLAICYHLNLEQAASRSFPLSFLLMFRFECCLCLFGNAECGTNHLKQCRCCTIQDSLPCAFLMSYCGLRVLACGTTDMCHLLLVQFLTAALEVPEQLALLYFKTLIFFSIRLLGLFANTSSESYSVQIRLVYS